MDRAVSADVEAAPSIGHAIVLVTGIQAAGKSTIAQLLAQRLPRSVHVRGDVFRRMVISGRAEMTPAPTAEAIRQLKLRYRLAAQVSEAYFEAGFTAVTQDIILGEYLSEMVRLIRRRPLLVVVLAPSAGTVAAREAARGKDAYDTWAVDELDGILRNGTPRLGLWLDTSAQTPEQTVDEILARGWAEARIPEPPRVRSARTSSWLSRPSASTARSGSQTRTSREHIPSSKRDRLRITAEDLSPKAATATASRHDRSRAAPPRRTRDSPSTETAGTRAESLVVLASLRGSPHAATSNR